jgi:hypothetical protein
VQPYFLLHERENSCPSGNCSLPPTDTALPKFSRNLQIRKNYFCGWSMNMEYFLLYEIPTYFLRCGKVENKFGRPAFWGRFFTTLQQPFHTAKKLKNRYFRPFLF